MDAVASLLTPRELDIIEAYAEGLKAPEIAGLMHLSPSSIRNHTTRIRAKLGAKTMAQAVAMVLAP